MVDNIHQKNSQSISQTSVPSSTEAPKTAKITRNKVALEVAKINARTNELAQKQIHTPRKSPSSSQFIASTEVQKPQTEKKIDKVSVNALPTREENLEEAVKKYLSDCKEAVEDFAEFVLPSTSTKLEQRSVVSDFEAQVMVDEWGEASKELDEILKEKPIVSKNFEGPTSDKASGLAKKTLINTPLKSEQRASKTDEPISGRARKPLELDAMSEMDLGFEVSELIEDNVSNKTSELAKKTLIGTPSQPDKPLLVKEKFDQMPQVNDFTTVGSLSRHHETEKKKTQDNEDFQHFANLLKELNSNNLEKKLIQKDKSLKAVDKEDLEYFVVPKKSRFETLQKWFSKISHRGSISKKETESTAESQKALETIFTKINFQLFLGKTSYLDKDNERQDLHKLASDFINTAYAQNEIRNSSRLGSLIGSYFIARIKQNLSHESDPQAMNARYQDLNKKLQNLLQPTYQGEKALTLINEIKEENEKYISINKKLNEVKDSGKYAEIKDSLSKLLIMSPYNKNYAKSLDVFFAKNISSPVKVNEKPLIPFPKISQRKETSLPQVVEVKPEIQAIAQPKTAVTEEIAKVALPVIEAPVVQKQSPDQVFENSVRDLIGPSQRKSARKSQEAPVLVKELSNDEIFTRFEEHIQKLKADSDDFEDTLWQRLTSLPRHVIGPSKEVDAALEVILSKAQAAINEGIDKYSDPNTGVQKSLTKLIDLFLDTDYAQNVAEHSSKLKPLMELHKFRTNESIQKHMNAFQVFDKEIFNQYETQFKKLVKNFDIKKATEFNKQINNEALRIEFRKKNQEQLKQLPIDSKEASDYMNLITIEPFDIGKAEKFSQELTNKISRLQFHATFNQLESKLNSFPVRMGVSNVENESKILEGLNLRFFQLKQKVTFDTQDTYMAANLIIDINAWDKILAFRTQGNTRNFDFKEVSYSPMKDKSILENAAKIPQEIQELLKTSDVFKTDNMQKLSNYFTDLKNKNALTIEHEIINERIEKLKNSYITATRGLMELYETESAYQKDLVTLRDYFETLKKAQLLSNDEEAIIGNLNKMIKVGNAFLKQLEKIKDGNATINEKLEAYNLALSPQYINFYLETFATLAPKTAYLQRRFNEINKDKKGKEINDRFIIDPEHKQLDPLAYLIKPVQRLLKYQLLMRDINKNIPGISNSASLKALYENQNYIEEYCRAINELAPKEFK